MSYLHHGIHYINRLSLIQALAPKPKKEESPMLFNANINGSNEPTIDILAANLVAAKEKLEMSKVMVAEAEAAILELLPPKPEGVAHSQGERFTIITTGKMARSLDREALDASTLPAEIIGTLISQKPMLSVKEFKKLAVSDPDAYRLACQFVTSKPGKPSVRVEEVQS